MKNIMSFLEKIRLVNKKEKVPVKKQEEIEQENLNKWKDEMYKNITKHDISPEDSGKAVDALMKQLNEKPKTEDIEKKRQEILAELENRQN